MTKAMYRCLILTLLPLFSFAQAQPVETQIETVTVYPSRAQVTRVAKLQLAAGASEFRIPQLSNRVIQKTIQLSLSGNGVNLQKISYQKNYLESPQLAEEEQGLQDSLEYVTNQEFLERAALEVLDGQEAILKANQRVYSNEAGVNIEDLQKLLDYYRDKLAELRQERIQVTKDIRALVNRKKALQQQLTSLASRRKSETGEIVVNVQSRQAQTVDLQVSYLVSNASWEPQYDVRAKDFDQPLEVRLKASIRQNTGQDWTNAQIQLSNAEPILNNNHPTFSPLLARQLQYGMDTVMTFDPTSYEEQVSVVRNEIELEEWSESEQNLTNRLIRLTNVETIQSNNQEQLVTVWEKEIPAQLQYYSLPRQSAYVYLLAEITNYGQYELEPGNASIFNGDTYIGETWLDTDSAEDTLQLSLGIDQDLSVERAGRDFSEKKWLGSNRKETYEYDLCIRNNKAQTVTVRLLDQIPISTNKDIEIELLKRDGANYNKRTGGLTWQVEAQPNQAAHRKFSYSIRYPKNMELTGKW